MWPSIMLLPTSAGRKSSLKSVPRLALHGAGLKALQLAVPCGPGLFLLQLQDERLVRGQLLHAPCLGSWLHADPSFRARSFNSLHAGEEPDPGPSNVPAAFWSASSLCGNSYTSMILIDGDFFCMRERCLC